MRYEVEKKRNKERSGKGTEWRMLWKRNEMKEEVERERNKKRSGQGTEWRKKRKRNELMEEVEKKRDKGIRKRMKRIEAKYKNTTVPPWKERNEGWRKRMKRIEAKYKNTTIPPWLRAVRVKYWSARGTMFAVSLSPVLVQLLRYRTPVGGFNSSSRFKLDQDTTY